MNKFTKTFFISLIPPIKDNSKHKTSTLCSPLFSFLFGYSANFIVRPGAVDGRRRWSRRLLGLALIGLAHAVFFFVGDILLAYAILGAGLIPLLGRSDRTVLITGAVVAGIGLLWLGLLTLAVLVGDPGITDQGGGPFEAYDRAMATGTFLGAAEARLDVLPAVLVALGSIQWPLAFAAFCAGLVAGRHRLLADPAENLGRFRRMALIGIGVGLPVQDASGNMIIDIGGGTTEMAIISLGGIVFSRSVRVAGDELDEAIMNYLKRAYNLMIGERTAEDIKVKIGSVYPMEKETSMEVRGRDLVAGLPKTLSITSQEVREALLEPIQIILESVRLTLERCPPELSSDLVERGVVLAGGGALLRGLDRLLSEETGLPIHVAEDPLSAVVEGTGKVLDELEFLTKLTMADGRS